MKNLKINDKKIKDVFKIGIAITTIVSTLVAVSGCDKEPQPEDITYTSQEIDNSEAYVKTVIRDGQQITLYRCKNIALVINKENYEVKEYVLHNEDISDKTVELEKGYIIAAGFIITSPSDYNVSSTKIILDENYVVEFANINDYIKGHELKDYYTLDEIKELEPIVIKSIKKQMNIKTKK